MEALDEMQQEHLDLTAQEEGSENSFEVIDSESSESSSESFMHSTQAQTASSIESYYHLPKMVGGMEVEEAGEELEDSAQKVEVGSTGTESSSGGYPSPIIPESSTQHKGWHDSIPLEIRVYFINELAKSICPHPTDMHDQLLEDHLIHYAKVMEKQMFETASDESGYHYMLTEKIRQIKAKKAQKLLTNDGGPSPLSPWAPLFEGYSSMYAVMAAAALPINTSNKARISSSVKQKEAPASEHLGNTTAKEKIPPSVGDVSSSYLGLSNSRVQLLRDLALITIFGIVVLHAATTTVSMYQRSQSLYTAPVENAFPPLKTSGEVSGVPPAPEKIEAKAANTLSNTTAEKLLLESANNSAANKAITSSQAADKTTTLHDGEEESIENIEAILARVERVLKDYLERMDHIEKNNKISTKGRSKKPLPDVASEPGIIRLFTAAFIVCAGFGGFALSIAVQKRKKSPPPNLEGLHPQQPTPATHLTHGTYRGNPLHELTPSSSSERDGKMEVEDELSIPAPVMPNGQKSSPNLLEGCSHPQQTPATPLTTHQDNPSRELTPSSSSERGGKMEVEDECMPAKQFLSIPQQHRPPNLTREKAKIPLGSAPGLPMLLKSLNQQFPGYQGYWESCALSRTVQLTSSATNEEITYIYDTYIAQMLRTCEEMEASNKVEQLACFLFSIPQWYLLELAQSEVILRSWALVYFHASQFEKLYAILANHKFSVKHHPKLQSLWWEAHNREAETKPPVPLSNPINMYHLRKECPPPSTICDNGKPKSELAKAMLNTLYGRNPHPNKAVLEKLALHIGMTVAQVESWFSDKRNCDHQQRQAATATAGRSDEVHTLVEAGAWKEKESDGKDSLLARDTKMESDFHFEATLAGRKALRRQSIPTRTLCWSDVCSKTNKLRLPQNFTQSTEPLCWSEVF